MLDIANDVVVFCEKSEYDKHIGVITDILLTVDNKTIYEIEIKGYLVYFDSQFIRKITIH